jgi:hypothetical protein
MMACCVMDQGLASADPYASAAAQEALQPTQQLSQIGSSLVAKQGHQGQATGFEASIVSRIEAVDTKLNALLEKLAPQHKAKTQSLHTADMDLPVVFDGDQPVGPDYTITGRKPAVSPNPPARNWNVIDYPLMFDGSQPVGPDFSVLPHGASMQRTAVTGQKAKMQSLMQQYPATGFFPPGFKWQDARAPPAASLPSVVAAKKAAKREQASWATQSLVELP